MPTPAAALPAAPGEVPLIHGPRELVRSPARCRGRPGRALLGVVAVAVWGLASGRPVGAMASGGAGWGSAATLAQDTVPRRPVPDTARRAPPLPARGDSARADSTRADSLRGDPLRALLDTAAADTTPQPLSFTVDARLESKAERSRDETCSSNPALNLSPTCRTFFQPNFDFQFSVRSAGSVGERLHVDVDYDSQREFDASNRIAVRYEGKPNAALQRVEVGNVTFLPPPSRFITAGIPMGNYGVQAVGRLGPWSLQAIAAQQRGNVVAEKRFTVGGRSRQQVEREIDDYELEPRRFFFTVDPAAFGSLYPNLDILDPAAMARARDALGAGRQPVRVSVYRQIIGGRPPNPNGPRFRLNGDPTSRRGPAYELLRENVDYYMDPSRLWFALVRPLGLYDERLVVAFTVQSAGREIVVPEIGGTPDVEFVDRDQVANLVWEPRLEPDDPAFKREIRSVYRVGGRDVERRTVQAAILTWAGGDQERPLDGIGQTYLQRFGLAERTNPGVFDVENRLWPRPADPNVVIGGGEWAPILRDQFLVFPSLEPFSRRGLAGPSGNPANDTLYRIPGEYLYSAQHPAPAYRIRVAFTTDAGDSATVALGAVQIRQHSERVTLDGRLLRRGLDYEVDYDLGVLRFVRADTLLVRERELRVRFEESPLFASVPTSVVGLTSQLEFDQGVLAFTAIGQRQRTVFNRPPLGYEAAASLVAGVSGAFGWDAAPLTRWLDGLPGVRAAGPSRVTVSGEFATSRPQLGAGGQAYLESFEGERGLQPSLLEGRWYYGSVPAPSTALDRVGGGALFGLDRAATMAWQNNGRLVDGSLVAFTIAQIDPAVRQTGTGVAIPEQILWLTMHPLGVGGLFRDGNPDQPRWRIAGAPSGRRWRSIHTALGTTGADLTRAEAIEFWTLVDTDAARRDENPTLVIDLGDVSENSLRFAPDTARVAAGIEGVADTTFRGKQLQGADSLDSELDPFTRSFNAARDDVGLPGDLVDRLRLVAPDGARDTTGFALCARGTEQVFRLGDTRADCTARNNRPDTEDLDGDFVLNLDQAALGAERIRRYVVDLGDPALRARVGRCGVVVESPALGVPPRPRCWVQVRVPFAAPDDSLNGGPPLRRVQAMRVTMISGATTPDGQRVQVPLVALRFTGSPWLKRTERTTRGIAGEAEGLGTVIATVVGTADRDSLAGLFYESPPGVVDEPDQRQTEIEGSRTQINERSLRLRAANLQPLERAEAYYRFPEGEKTFLGYRELRLWARGRGTGWTFAGELQFYVKIGRDADNFYMYRTPANAGLNRAAWQPELRVDLRRFTRLRARLQQLYLQSPGGAIECGGVDSALVAATPEGASPARFAVCEDGYVVYTANPAVSPPNLAAVQELAVGIVRLPSGPTSTLAPGDTAEVWVNDLRLDRVEDTPGYAGTLSLGLQASDVADVALSVTRRDPYFRQLAEQASFRTDDALEAAATLRLDRLLPAALNLALPVTVRHTVADVDPLFVTETDYEASAIGGIRTPRASSTSVTASIRRARPVGEDALDALLDHLSLTAGYVGSNARTEYQRGAARDVSAALEYVVAAPARTVPIPRWVRGLVGRLPGWLERSAGAQALREARVRWNPAELRLSTGLARATDTRTTYVQLAPSAFDPGGRVSAESFVWRSGGSLALRPAGALGVHVELTSIRDLRDYGDSTVSGFAASRARRTFLGADAGYERERVLTGTVSFAPVLAPWFRPRAELRTRFDLLRDPNRPPLLFTESGDPLLGTRLDSVGGVLAVDPATGRRLVETVELQRRLGNERIATTGLVLDLARALRAYGDSAQPLVRWALGALQPLDVSYTRSLRSAYAGVGFMPGFGYQLGLGGVAAMRRAEGVPASSAGSAGQLAATQTVLLPAGLAVVARLTRSSARTWTAQPFGLDDDAQRLDSGSQMAFPDVALRWSLRAPGPRSALRDASASARVLHTRQRNVSLADAGPGLRETRATRVRSYPVTGALTWAYGDITTAGGYTLSQRTDTLPGTVIRSTIRDASADVGRPFDLPQSWKLRSDLRTRLSYQYSRSRSLAASVADADLASRLLDNGRWSLSLNADTDVAENVTFVLQGARIVTFDDNLGRRFVQTVLTTALQLQFFSGKMF